MKNGIKVQLDDLFERWEKEQIKEIDDFEQSKISNSYLNEYNANCSLKKINRRKSFTRDGIINEEKWNDGAKILFVLKEANVEGSIEEFKKSSECKDDTFEADVRYEGRFWFKSEVEKNIAEKNRIGRRLKKIGVSLTKDENFSLETIAYMNLNKRGGLKSQNKKVIKGYLEYYKEFITEEIKIINPNIIVVCCGKHKYAYAFKEILDKEFQDKEKRYYYHPSYRISNDRYFKGIEL